VRKAASESLLAWVADQGESVVREPGGSLVVVEIMLFADGGKRLSILHESNSRMINLKIKPRQPKPFYVRCHQPIHRRMPLCLIQ